MGRIINPRGTSGAGKTWLVRAIIAASLRAGAAAVPLRREGRARPIGWRLLRPVGAHPLAVIGHYEATRGGTDTIPRTDGGLDEAFRLAATLAAEGHDVLMEGYQLSAEFTRTAALARAQRERGRGLHVLWLNVPLDDCIRNVMTRRRASQAARPAIERTACAGHAALTSACQALQHAGVDVERLGASAALHRTRALLGLDPSWLGGPRNEALNSFSPACPDSPPVHPQGDAITSSVESWALRV